MAKKARPGKGSFGGARLPVAGAYVTRSPRRWLLGAGFAGCLGALAWLGASFALGDRTPVSPGPLSSSHANFEANCGACHGGFEAPAAAGCLACHGRVGEGPEEYRYAAHYAYRRPAPVAAGAEAPTATPAAARAVGRELPCASCHAEHGGRRAALTRVPDARCTGCHAFGSFGGGHPEVEVIRDGLRDDPNLRFPHRIHVAEVTKRLGLGNPERSCLQCHEPDDRGRGFRPLDFDRHCDACHLTATSATPRLPAGDPADPARPGVLTLSALQREWGPGVRWALFTNPDEVREAGGTVAKRPVYHEDPWILENLRRIRATLYGDLGLAALLSTGVDEGTVLAGGDALYREAIATLRERAAELRSLPGPEVQEELRRLEELLAVAEERVERGEGTASTAPFVPGSGRQPGYAPGLSEERVMELKRLALDLTEPCRQCHVVSDAAIQRVQKDQRTLIRAEFDHRAHIVQLPSCLGCHGAIPKILAGEPKGEDDPTDAAETHNLPAIAVCRECHTPAGASSACVTCHQFHPGRSRHAGLVVYRSAAGD
ncbi:MAG TPA: hypothetical protein VMR44_02825 [Thermoanaerobaculia bacterium]|nr:hypothetical protein [Thermoanaerobaculia bacterium]